MEEEGIFWFAEHDGKKCNMVVADDNSVAKTPIKLRLSTIAHDTEDETVLSWFNVSQDVRPGKYTLSIRLLESEGAIAVALLEGLARAIRRTDRSLPG